MASDWDRVLEYSHRVKSLLCRDRQPHIGEPALIRVYETVRQGLSPMPYHILCPVVAALGQMSESLISEELHPVDEYPTDSDHRRIYSFLRTLTHVEVLNVSVVDAVTLTHLGRLTSLKTLSTVFPNLRAANIAVGGGKISALIAFMRMWKTPRLISFEVEVNGFGEFECIRDFDAVLGTQCEHNERQTLSVQRYHGHADSIDIIIPHSGHPLRPLFAFNHLTTLHIRVPSGYELDDATISDMARAWPCIEIIVLRCPTITLNIRPNAHSLPSMPSHNTTPILQSSPVAVFLSCIFLKLTKIGKWGWQGSGNNEEERYKQHWSEVEQLAHCWFYLVNLALGYKLMRSSTQLPYQSALTQHPRASLGLVLDC
ncbi:hypothetical protein B0H17DRAFT_1138682 [Mycena rosella]|uniref:Uncharacterized protein n=1 Tax=Mycena rosella TaxID=1033263 RepID=A0AAD7D5U9_MYCRO|nr:hypothetical protein B0H17DRAFT_1138682 [Mycena rosella]